MARCSGVKIDPNYSSDSVYSLNQIEQYHDTLKNALKELPSWIANTDINNALFALTAQAEVAVEYDFNRSKIPNTGYYDYDGSFKSNIECQKHNHPNVFNCPQCNDESESDVKQFIQSGTYVFDAVMNGDAIESENKIVGITGRNYNTIETENNMKLNKDNPISKLLRGKIRTNLYSYYTDNGSSIDNHEVVNATVDTLYLNDIHVTDIDVYCLWSAWSHYNDASWLDPIHEVELLRVVKEYISGKLKLV